MVIYKSPKTLYHSFINAYSFLECGNLSKQDALIQSNKKWKESKNDAIFVKMIIDSAPKIEIQQREKVIYSKWVIYKNPKTLYHKFINAYVKKEYSTALSKQEIVLLAIQKWKDIRKDTAKVEGYLSGGDLDGEVQTVATMVDNEPSVTKIES